MLTVTKTFEFAYAHCLPKYDGLCANVHGHTGILEVEVEGSFENDDLYPTMIIDFNEMKKVVNEAVIEKLDHHYLNDLFEYPTAETMTMWATTELKKSFGGWLVRVRMYETPTSYAEWRRD